MCLAAAMACRLVVRAACLQTPASEIHCVALSCQYQAAGKNHAGPHAVMPHAEIPTSWPNEPVRGRGLSVKRSPAARKGKKAACSSSPALAQCL